MKIGLLPFYIKLYDDFLPDYSQPLRTFTHVIAEELRTRGFDVMEASACRVKHEFAQAVSSFEMSGCQAIATLHLAYSPSLEASDALAETSLPVVVIDTTPDFNFTGPADIMPNHGIHGVQDFCNLMRRKHKPFQIAVGHWQHSKCLDEAATYLKAAGMAWQMTHSRVGIAGGLFQGMGDFQIPAGSFGMTLVPYLPQPRPAEAEIDQELLNDKARFEFDDNLDEVSLRRSVGEGLKVRHWIEREKLDAFTICFLGISRQDGWETVPFLECSKAIARGVGYAGEGDVLTAAMTRCLAEVFPETSFMEMFCPDWKNDRIFTSHMGEINLDLCSTKPLIHSIRYKYSDTDAPVIATGCFKPGYATLVNLAPEPDGAFTLITANVNWQSCEESKFTTNSGWFQPQGRSVSDFLKSYSLLGGTHHLATIYHPNLDILKAWANLMGWNYVCITD